MPKIDTNTIIPPELVGPIFQELKEGLLRAAKPEYRSQVLKIKMPRIKEAKPLGKLLGKMLQPFRTQTAGGFEITQEINQESIETMLQKQIEQFDGLICGVEASADTIIRNATHHFLQEDEAIVYSQNQSSTLSKTSTISLTGYPGQSIRLNRYSPNEDGFIWLGHISSGTSEPKKFPHNRQAFLQVLSGKIMIDEQKYNPLTDISFWDANFDCTDAVNIKHEMPSSLELLLSFTIRFPIQFIIPAVRVRKKRIANHPFANNQLHKGGIEQIGESMIGTCPQGLFVKALDSDGLFVFSEGKIHHLRPNSEPKELPSIRDMLWLQYSAFSQEVLLDHKPIQVQLGSRRYSFHNFMDFKGNKGIVKDFWYDNVHLKTEEQHFLHYLHSLEH